MKGLALLAAAVASAVFEPIVAIDPDFPDRIAAGAQLGEGYNRGGLRFVTWASSDGGRNWTSQEVALRDLARPPTMAADLSLAFGLEGELYGFGISGDGYRDRVPEAALALAVSQDGGRSFAPRALLGETEDHGDGSFSVSDKPWLAIDRGAKSPLRGSLYFAWTRIRVRRLPDGYDLERDLVFSFSRDAGRSHPDPVSIAGSGGGAQIAVRPGGLVDLVWLEEEEYRSGRVLHRVSKDGGRSFSPESAIETLEGDSESLDLPALAASSTGALAACWPRGPVSTAAGTSMRCSSYSEERGWTPSVVESDAALSGYPAVASTGDAFWLLAYQVRENLQVSLFCSRGGGSFGWVSTLSESALPPEKFCARPGLACRKDPDAFTPGDYVGLAASPRRLAAAYVLPGPRAVVSVVDLGDAPCSIESSRSWIAP